MLKGLWFFCSFGWKTDKRYILWNVIHQIVNSVLPIVATIMPRSIIDELVGARRMAHLVFYVGILAGYTLVASCLSTYFFRDGFTRRCRVSAAFDLMLHKNLADADWENLENPAFLDLKEKANKFLYCDWHGFSYLFDCALTIVGQCVTLFGIGAIIATLSIPIVLLFVVLVALGAWVEGWASKHAHRLSLEVVRNQRGWRYYGELFENVAYGKEIRMNGLGDWLLSRERMYTERCVANLKRQNDFHIKSGIVGAALTFLQQCAAYAYLIGRVLSGAITIGGFTMYVGAVTAFAASLRALMGSIVEIRTYSVYFDALDEYLHVPKRLRASGGKSVPTGGCAIEFRNVSFRYPGQESYALRNVNLTLRQGEKLSIVGENGAGKTSFVKLLCRLYDPTEGEILLNGVNIRDIDYDAYVSLLSTVFQDFKLFSFFLKENVALSREVSDRAVEEVLERVGMSEKLRSLSHDIHTGVYKDFDEAGFEPSGGEGQKIALARAICRESSIVILDEPTAALDPRAEVAMLESFNEMVAGKTAVYISHRLSSARFCDTIAVFANGEIVERGTHEELLEQNGVYSELFHMQAQYYRE